MVRKIGTHTTIRDLFNCFSNVGPIRNIVIPISRGVFHGYAFVDFFEEKHVDEAIRQMDEVILEGSKIAVSWAERWTPTNIRARDIVHTFQSARDQALDSGSDSPHRERKRSPSPYIRRPRNVSRERTSNEDRRHQQPRGGVERRRRPSSPYSRGLSSPYSRHSNYNYNDRRMRD